MATPYQAIIAPHSAMIRLAECEPAVAAPGETVVIRAEVIGAELPAAIEMRIRSSKREIVAHGSLTRLDGPQYTESWSTSADTPPGAYDVLLRLPGDERSSLVTITLLPEAFAARMPQLEKALQYRQQAQVELENGRLAESAALMESAIAAYESAGQPNAAAAAMLDAANLYAALAQPQKAAALRQRAQSIRNAE